MSLQVLMGFLSGLSQSQNMCCACFFCIGSSCPTGASPERNCRACIDGYYGDPANEKPCQKCVCNNNIDPNVTGNCDTRNGDCLKCINNTTGRQCQTCARLFYGDAVNGTCLRK